MSVHPILRPSSHAVAAEAAEYGPLGDGPPLELPWRKLPGYNCFGCCRDNPAGLRLVVRQWGEDGVSSTVVLSAQYESYPGLIHGGIASAVLDELMGNAIALIARKVCFTTSMRVRFLRPVQTGVGYRAIARIVDTPPFDEGDIFKAEADMFDAHGDVVVSANGVFHWVTAEQADAFIRPNPARDPRFASYFRWSS